MKEAGKAACALAILCLAFAACGKKRTAEAPEQARQIFTHLSLNQSELNSRTWSLEASSATLSRDAQTALLFSPQMRFYKDNRLDSTLSADAGVLDTQTQDVHMQGNVVVQSLADKTTLRTSALDYSSAKKEFTTRQEVTIQRPSGITRGAGLEASSDFSRIRIFHQKSVISGRKS